MNYGFLFKPTALSHAGSILYTINFFHLFLSLQLVTRAKHVTDVRKGFTRLLLIVFHGGQVPGAL